MTEEEKAAVPANPVLLEFPFDQYGFTQRLKTEGMKAAGRVHGDVKNLQAFVGVLDILRAHAVNRCKEQMATKINRTEAEKTRKAQEAARREQDRVKSIKIHEKRLAELEAAAPATEPTE